ncbi:hypothetical protein R5R35_005238 [Gryllus longicercus]|uniref:UPF3 domain-containing protein n=1 Tax=Gryllus longicercus TaxID=2509291 RepID=A0AAN9Z8M4_9ORTH
MSEVEVDEIKNNIQNTLKSKSKESVSDEQGSKSKRVVFQEKPIILNKVSPKISEPTAKSEGIENEKKEKKERNRPPTKVVVRRLPPTMTLETFVDNVSPLPEHDYVYFVRADMSLGTNAFSRAYINFINMDDLLTFYEQFDNYVFMDSKGNEYPAVVEFAPFQRVPKKRPVRKKDPKVGTLKDDPTFMTFVAGLKEKKDTSSVKQASAEHLLALTTEGANKKEVSTPLLEFIKQRRAERQRVREEKREERKRKELERKRIKEEERKRRKDNDSVLKVLRNPEHEDKEETAKNGKERDRNQQIIKKREDERKHREKDRKDKRDLKSRDGPPKTYRDDRQKQVDGRMPRKIIEEQRRKLGGERTLVQNKSELRNNPEYDKTGQTKESDPRKSPGFSRDQDQKKGPNDKYQSHSKDGDRFTREIDGRKNYKENDAKKPEKPQAFVKDNEFKRNNYETRRVSNSFSEGDAKRKPNDNHSKNNVKSNDQQEFKSECSKSQGSEETDRKKWELLGAKPKRLVSEDDVSNLTSENNFNKSKDSSSTDLKENMPDPSIIKLYGIHKPIRIPIEAVKCDTVPGVLLKRRSSLDSDSQHMRSFERMCMKPRRQVSLDSEMFFKNVCVDSSTKTVMLTRSQEFEKRIETMPMTRRSSLDSGDFKKKAMTCERFGSPTGNIMKFKSDLFFRDNERKPFIVSKPPTDTKSDASKASEKQEESKKMSEHEDQKFERNRCDPSKNNENKTESSAGEGNKRDPRAERRIRNKDRPSIEIYRPGMGRFSMQRKEREKNAGVGSSTEQESPSNSPSPTPSSRLINSSKGVKNSQELRSMTFKRSVSREK